MRMIRKLLKRRVSEEGGAVLAIVVISLVAILGMVALSVDGGGMVLERRALVNANDAAALAFAQQCALGNGEGAATAAANAVATDNVAGSVADHVTVISGSCSGFGTVEVEYVHDRRMYFAPIVGFPNTVDVAAVSQATWGPLEAASNVAPLELDSSQLRDICGFHPELDPPQPPVGTPCYFWYDNVAASSQFGVMNLDLWGVRGNDQCSSAGANDRSDWILSGYPGLLALKDPPPTYVCLDTGANESNWMTLEDEVGKEKLFPVNDSTGFSGYPQVTRLGANCTDADALAGLCTPDKYSIVGFAILKVTAVYDGNDPAAIGTPAQSGSCGPFNWTFSATDTSKDITTLSIPACSTSNIDLPGNPTGAWPRLRPRTGTTTFTHVTGTTCPVPPQANTYIYDEATHVVTWCGTLTGTQTQQVRIDWDYTNPATPGLCGVHSSDPTGKCLATEYRGFTTNAGSPCVLPPCPASNIVAITLTK